MEASVYVRIPEGSGNYVAKIIDINENENIKSLKNKIKEETMQVEDLNFILKDGKDNPVTGDEVIKNVEGYDDKDGTLTLTLHFQSGGDRRYKKKVKKTKKRNKKSRKTNRRRKISKRSKRR
tara:strand:+ start:328 stop:693 length:366 start_codon:yes stop_codon:yes gene_type:complete